jgi:hypothetical protein
MTRVPVKGYIYSSNICVITTVCKHKTTPTNKSNSICYHTVHEVVSMVEALVVNISTKKKFAVLFIKIMYG